MGFISRDLRVNPPGIWVGPYNTPVMRSIITGQYYRSSLTGSTSTGIPRTVMPSKL